MHIAFGADDQYSQHVGVTLASILSTLAPGIEPNIYIVTDGISEENQRKIASLKTIRNFHPHYIVVSLDDFKDFPLISDHITIATYFRLQLPYLLPQLDKVLYLDTDMIIDRDLSPLWETDLEPDQWVAAAAEIAIKPDFMASIGLDKNEFYFNAGVLLMNLAALRANDFENKCAKFVRQYREVIRYVDQDVLNHVCKGHVKWVDPKFNLVFAYLDKRSQLKKLSSPYSLQTIHEAIAHPVIIHYTGALKPWHYASRNVYSYKYMDYLKLTPWKSYQYPDKNFKNFKSKNLYFLRQWIKQIQGK